MLKCNIWYLKSNIGLQHVWNRCIGQYSAAVRGRGGGCVCRTPRSTVLPRFFCSVTVWGVCTVWGIHRALLIRMGFVGCCFAHILCAHWEWSVSPLHCMWEEDLRTGRPSRVFHGHACPYHGRVASVPPQACVQTWKAPGQSAVPQSRRSKWG